MAAGVRAGAPIELTARVFHEDGYDLTAIAGASMVEQLLAGGLHRSGLHRMGLIVDPDRLLADLTAMGARVATDAPVVLTGNHAPLRRPDLLQTVPASAAGYTRLGDRLPPR